jgi:hypothetical protein
MLIFIGGIIVDLELPLYLWCSQIIFNPWIYWLTMWGMLVHKAKLLSRSGVFGVILSIDLMLIIWTIWQKIVLWH